MTPRFIFATLLALTLITLVIKITLYWHWDWSLLLQAPDLLSLEQATVKMAILPEISIAFLTGALLSVASTALQHIIRNNLASDSTLAVGSGAQLALMTATIFLPNFSFFGSFWIAFIGALCSTILVLYIGQSKHHNPNNLILSGLVINIIFGALATIFILFYYDSLLGIMVWGNGSLLQDGWQSSWTLLSTALVIAFVFTLLNKPLTLFGLDDTQAKRLGVPVNFIRYSVLIIVIAITALVVSEVGIIGFIGLAGASTVKLLSLKHIHHRLLASFIVGGLLLLLTHNIVGIIEFYSHTILETGALTSLLGAPLLIYLVLKQGSHPPQTHQTHFIKRKDATHLLWISLASLSILCILLQGFTPTPYGWQWNWNIELIEQYRLPRSLSAIATGALLAVAGALLQIMTRNPMASPEILGISSANSLAVIIAFMLFPTIGNLGMISASLIGSFVMLLIMLMLARKVQPSSLLLIGVAISALASSVSAIAQTSANPRISAILNWLSGTSYYAQPERAYLLIVMAIILIGLIMLMIRPLRVMSLGENVSRSLGIPVRLTQYVLLFLVALMSAIATLAIGPLSFVGLITPHIAKKLGAITPTIQLPSVAILGAMIMLVADWLGRYIIFPYEFGAGVIASIAGGIYFLFLMKQQRNA